MKLLYVYVHAFTREVRVSDGLHPQALSLDLILIGQCLAPDLVDGAGNSLDVEEQADRWTRTS